MSDLISRSALIKKLESMSSDNDVRNNSHQFTYKELAYIICNQPTAYDIEKVVEELACNSRFIDDINEHNIKCISCVIGQKTAIDIVRKGGVE